MLTKQDIIDKTRSFIEEHLTYGEPVGDDDTPIFSSGVVDSLGSVQLVEFLKQEFGVDIKLDEIVPENIDGLNLIANFIIGKL